MGVGGGGETVTSVSFLQNSQKYKKYLYIWQVGKSPGYPLLNFLDTPLNFISFIKRHSMAHGICVLNCYFSALSPIFTT